MTPNRNSTLIERYRSSDDEQRTYLFLSHPKLRREFMQIDLDDGSVHMDAKPAFRLHPVIIVGAGLNGLAAAYALKKRGIMPVILDAADKPAAAWRKRHDQLRLNTHRLISHLPGKRIPRRFGAFPTRDDMVAYLEAYERFLNVPIRRGVRILRIDRKAGAWQMTASDGFWQARDVIIATGNEHRPVVPQWPGRQEFTGEILHAADLGSIERYRNRSVLVVGAGNSGTDVLNHLVGIETKKIWVSVRNGPTVLPTRLMGIPLQLLSPLMVPLPPRVTDVLMAATERLVFGNLKKYHLSKHPDGVATRLIKEGVAPAFDNGFIAALKAGRVTVLPQIEGFDGGEVLLAGGGRVRPDVVICATGYSPGLENMVGHLGVLDDYGNPAYSGPEAHLEFEGLWFMGMKPRLPGVFYAARGEARRLAALIKKRQAVIQEQGALPARAMLAQ